MSISIQNHVIADKSVQKNPKNEDYRGRERYRRKKRFGIVDSRKNRNLGLLSLPGMIDSLITFEQMEAYAVHFRIEEISQKLRISDVIPRDGERSPSPPPQYDNFGRRTNTREIRYKNRLENERHTLVDKAMKTIPDYKSPSDYRRPNKLQDKIYIPVNDYPEINFIGLLIGPRGNTLKNMEKESGAKIAIRGKGSVKEGKGRSDQQSQSNAEEDLHCLIMADHEDKVKHAIRLVEKIIETAASIPEAQNDLKRSQLRELATLNGTLRDDENQVCQNCGNVGHGRYYCPEQKMFSANIVCRNCGQAGHLARDCTVTNNQPNNQAQVDQEYQNLMLELKGGEQVAQLTSERNSIAPWASVESRDNTTLPWSKSNNDLGTHTQNFNNAPPPWANATEVYHNSAPKYNPTNMENTHNRTSFHEWQPPYRSQKSYPSNNGEMYSFNRIAPTYGQNIPELQGQFTTYHEPMPDFGQNNVLPPLPPDIPPPPGTTKSAQNDSLPPISST